MKKRYDQLMDKIELTPEMKQRILHNIEQVELDTAAPVQANVVRFQTFKKYLPAAACIAVLLLGAVTLPNLIRSPQEDSPDIMTPNFEIITVSSLQDLSDTLGFEMEELTGLPFTVNDVTYTAYGTEMGEICYTGTDETVMLRKSPGADDISGDYNEYNSIEEINIDSRQITLKGNDDTYVLAIWNDSTYSYSISFSNSITKEEWTSLLSDFIK